MINFVKLRHLHRPIISSDAIVPLFPPSQTHSTEKGRHKFLLAYVFVVENLSNLFELSVDTVFFFQFERSLLFVSFPFLFVYSSDEVRSLARIIVRKELKIHKMML